MTDFDKAKKFPSGAKVLLSASGELTGEVVLLASVDTYRPDLCKPTKMVRKSGQHVVVAPMADGRQTLTLDPLEQLGLLRYLAKQLGVRVHGASNVLAVLEKAGLGGEALNDIATEINKAAMQTDDKTSDSE